MAALLILLGPELDPARPAVSRTAAIAVWMALWWLTECIPLAATALLPLAFFPLLGIVSGGDIAGAYINSTIFLFVGGFLLALAMERWHLHRRIALRIILWSGSSSTRLVLGFMLAAGLLSMWISNTATAIMMLPMALAVIRRAEYNASEQADDRGAEGLSKCLLLGMAYAASIGGMATPVGTPPNLIFMRIYAISFPEAPPISFGQWVVFGLPFSAIMLLLTWLLLTRVLYRNTLTHTVVDATAVREEYRLLGRMSREELLIMLVFSATAFLWCFRNDLVLGAWTVPGWSRLLATGDLIDDGTIAILMALLLFIIPTFRKQVPAATESEMPGAVSSPPATQARGTILDGEVFRQLPWAIVLLFGGGFALAEGFVQSGLADYLVGGFADLGKLPVFVVVAIIALGMTFLTELTSNTASTQMVLPVLAAAAVSQEIHPLLLMLPATLAASMAFMMPVATPPNAIVFSSERLRILDMARTGFIMNLIGVVLVTFFVVQVARVVFQIEMIK